MLCSNLGVSLEIGAFDGVRVTDGHSFDTPVTVSGATAEGIFFAVRFEQEKTPECSTSGVLGPVP